MNRTTLLRDYTPQPDGTWERIVTFRVPPHDKSRTYLLCRDKAGRLIKGGVKRP